MKKNEARKCYLCGAKKFERVKGRVRDLPGMPILRCKRCGLVFLASFNHIDDRYTRDQERQRRELVQV